jgi:vacuolar-type H+-ATPase subunit I/STV1
MTWFDGPIYLILAPVLFLLLASPIYAMVKHGRREGLGHLGEMGFDLFETAIAFTSNTVSYLRIFAMVIAHIELMAVFYSLAAMTAGAQFGFSSRGFSSWAGNIFVVLLEGILALAQDLRLHSMSGSASSTRTAGYRFSPFGSRWACRISKRLPKEPLRSSAAKNPKI